MIVILGFITTGNFSFSMGKGIGLGWIQKEINTNEKIIVLIRKPTSRKYYFAFC